MFGIPIGITSSVIGLKTCTIAAGIKMCKSTIKKKKKQNLLLEKSKFNNQKSLISKALTDSNISHDEFVLMNNVLKEYGNMKAEIKSSNNKKVCFL